MFFLNTFIDKNKKNRKYCLIKDLMLDKKFKNIFDDETELELYLNKLCEIFVIKKKNEDNESVLFLI